MSLESDEYFLTGGGVLVFWCSFLASELRLPTVCKKRGESA